MRRLIRVAFFLEVGLLLIFLPWWPPFQSSAFWDRNYFAVAWPFVRALVTNNFIRGAVSGLGVVNVIAGFAELTPLFAVRDRHDVSLTGRRAADAPRYPDTQVDR